MDAVLSLPRKMVPEELLTVKEQNNLDDAHQMLASSAVDQIMMKIGDELKSLKDSALSADV